VSRSRVPLYQEKRPVTTAPPTRYAAIYARVSTEDQGKGFSIPT
jgi:hypothetical protein